MSESCQQKKCWQAPENIKTEQNNICGPSARDKLYPTSYVFSYQNHIFPKYCDASKILCRYLSVLCHIKKIHGSLSLSILFLPNSNSFPLNSNIADTQRSKNPFSYIDKDRRKKRYVFYVSGKSPNLPMDTLNYRIGV